MKLKLCVCALALLGILNSQSIAQKKSDNMCYINNNRIYFQIDRRWTDQKKKEISALFNLDSAFIGQVLIGKPSFIYDSIEWQVNIINNNLLEVSKQIAQATSSFRKDDIFMFNDNWITPPKIEAPVFDSWKPYGLNSFKGKPSVIVEKDSVHFFLSGYPNAQKVFLSGSFNAWSTMRTPMKKTSNGWEIGLKLEPGKYLYKFIADGHWLHDQNNKLKESDANGGYNSVFYAYNNTFHLDNVKARRVAVTGSFLGWNKKGIPMEQKGANWELNFYLNPGTHAYKFIVDNKWIADPNCKSNHDDGEGNINSYLGIGDTLVFKLNGYTNAHSVVLTGNFCAWHTNEFPMHKTKDGWELPYVLASGNYEYKFIVDGKWITDPDNPITSGSGNSTNSCISFKPNHTFVLDKFADAKKVIVTGSFNGWREDTYAMARKDGRWTFSINLKPGKYTYKFIVDGKWMIDPSNELWEGNDSGTGNSVLWIEH